MTTSSIEKYIRIILLFLLTLFLAVHFPSKVNGLEIDVEIAPNMINVEGNMEAFVIHTNIAYGLVDLESVTLTVNETEVLVDRSKMDSLGQFDVIIPLFLIEEALVIGVENDFYLQGRTWNGELFWGVDRILVIDKSMQVGKL